jgi:hypothetical protein
MRPRSRGYGPSFGRPWDPLQSPALGPDRPVSAVPALHVVPKRTIAALYDSGMVRGAVPQYLVVPGDLWQQTNGMAVRIGPRSEEAPLIPFLLDSMWQCPLTVSLSSTTHDM